MPALFTLETEHLALVWSRRHEKTPPVEPEAADVPFGLDARCRRRGSRPVVRVLAGDIRYLFEQTDYTLFAQSKTGATVEIRHRDPVLLRGLHRSEDGRVVHGTVNFGSQIGRSRFVVALGGVPQFEFDVEVFPSKLDYRRDYEALRKDVREIATELVLAYLRATYEPGSGDVLEQTGATGWVMLLRHIMHDLELAIDHIARRPHWGTRRMSDVQRVDRIRRPDGMLRRAVRQGGGRGAWQILSGLAVRERLPAMRSCYTLDTPEHRWLAAQLVLMGARLAHVRSEEARHRPSVRRQRVARELEALHHRIIHLNRHTVIREAEGTAPGEPPLRLFTAPGYREAYRACLLLQQGLHFDGGPLRLGLKDLHLLYEYWCFLTVVRLAAEGVGQEGPVRSLIAVERHGLRLRLRKGHTQTVTFPLAHRRRLDLTYNPRFGGTGYLVPQQPDILLTLHHPDDTATRYVLDAKYRLDASPTYRRRYGFPGPPIEALNHLHRYRDAIRGRRQRGPERSVKQAIALFPYREAEPGRFEESRLHRMIGEIGVGAIPLLPGAVTHLRAWLNGVLEEGNATELA